jgi:hypothetical protein
VVKRRAIFIAAPASCEALRSYRERKRNARAFFPDERTTQHTALFRAGGHGPPAAAFQARFSDERENNPIPLALPSISGSADATISGIRH